MGGSSARSVGQGTAVGTKRPQSLSRRSAVSEERIFQTLVRQIAGNCSKMNTRDIIAAIISTCFYGVLRAVLRGGITSNWQKLDIVLQMSVMDNCSAIKT